MCLSNIVEIELDSRSGIAKVASNGKDIVDYRDFPVDDLTHQLKEWLDIVTEDNPVCFIYKNSNRSLFGTFRIEPRPSGWQFTSWNERERSEVILSLEQWRKFLKDAIQSST